MASPRVQVLALDVDLGLDVALNLIQAHDGGVADRLGIPHYVIDAERRFADAVIGDFADSYAAGETPVPCVRCNQTVKFADLTALARGLGAEQ